MVDKENPYSHLTTIPEIVEEAFKFLENALQKKSKLLGKAQILKDHFYSVLKSEIKKKKEKKSDVNPEDKTNVDDSEIFVEIMSDKKVKAKRTNYEGFRFRRKNVFLTYSDAQNDPSIDQVYKELRKIDKESKNPNKICNNIDFMLVVKEKHKNGVTHFHVFMQFFEQLDRSDSRLFDVPSLKHPEIVYVNNVKRVIKYMCKHVKTDEDRQNNLREFNLDHRFFLETTCESLDTLGYKLINKIISPIQAIKENPKLFFKADTLLRNHDLYHSEVEKLNNPGKELIDIVIGHREKNPLVFKFNKNKKKRENPQFWICGNTNSGKTYNVEQLELLGHRGYLGSKDNDWAGYRDEYWDFMYFEEYSGENTIQFMNQLLEGTKMDLKAKYGNKIRKNKNLPIFINSNMLPHEAYKNVSPERLNLLLQRMYIIYLAPDQTAHIIWDPSKGNTYNLYGLNCCDSLDMKNYLDGVECNCSMCKKKINYGESLCLDCKNILVSEDILYYSDSNNDPNSYKSNCKYDPNIVEAGPSNLNNVNIDLNNRFETKIKDDDDGVYIPPEYAGYEDLIRQFGSFENIPDFILSGTV